MQTFDQALFDLVIEGSIQEEEAIKNADSANNLRLKLKLHRDGPGTRPAAAAPTPPPAPTPQATPTQDAASWGLELKLEDLPEDEPPPEDPGKHY
jgi:twitching motility protein PilU